MPYVGLGLPLAGGYTEAERTAALDHFTVPPIVDLGLAFDPPSGGSLNIIGVLFDIWIGGDPFPGAPSAECPKLRGLHDFRQLVPFLFTVDLPGTGDYWGSAENFARLLTHFATSGTEVAALPVLEKWPYPLRQPLPYRRARARGDVTRSQVRAFAANFPSLAKTLEKAIAWSGPRGRSSAPAAEANAVARSLLGIRVDLRVGELVSAARIEEAKALAAGDVHFRAGGDQMEWVDERLDRCLQRVGAQAAARWAGAMRGAAWSCAVDVLMNPARTVCAG
jgi:hypothetical protein